MGLYYKLSNGNDIEIRIEEDENYNKQVNILLFGGSTVISSDLNKNISLNDIITDIEKNYNNLLQADLDFEYRCWCD